MLTKLTLEKLYDCSNENCLSTNGQYYQLEPRAMPRWFQRRERLNASQYCIGLIKSEGGLSISDVGLAPMQLEKVMGPQPD